MPAATLRDVLDAWTGYADARRSPAPDERLRLARSALDLGHPTLACEILREPMRRDDVDPVLRHLAALAHARIGDYRQAAATIAPLLDGDVAGTAAVDARALAGRIAKDRWARLPAGPARDTAAAEALRYYGEAWAASHDPFPGINAATLLLLTGQPDASRALARAVRDAVPDATDAPTHWREATLGEAALLLGEDARAAGHYAAAVAAAGRHVGHVASMRRQLRLLGEAIDIPDAVNAALHVPSVLVFTGHMIDPPWQHTARFPPALEAAVAARIRESVRRLGVGFGYCSAACGGDLLFVEALLECGAEVHITLPFDRNDFLATSVAFAGERWIARYRNALLRATSVTQGVRERFLGDEELFGYAAALIHGGAVLHAQQLDTDPTMLALVDADAPGGPGGTRDTLQRWDAHGLGSERIDLAALRRAHPHAAAPAATRAPRDPVTLRGTAMRRKVRTMLFADMVGFSKLGEEDTPSFLLNFIGAIAQIVQRSPHQPAFVNTWGDGLFLVFDEVVDGARFALQLRDEVERTDWPSQGLPSGTSIRIGMHTGPVFPAHDPILGRANFFGSHVIRAARIEPVAAPGAVYVSAETAALLAAIGGHGLATDYLGLLPLAKGYGSGALYRLRRSDEAE
ncbi:TRAFs-binding domain-containing protein [Chiayiivirga flava]|uniref:Class 3 adenylate cyclase n=1 Tax=Chiayiivirga flava TaxID=659595 RepID=A0A7W8D8T0_9GAMM|nr:TRAFs-binding domain-containing protein [Chiayiivirga flava]MBB5209712.1 class 3 adenylate cyclase [Chiayiivirga flava]